MALSELDTARQKRRGGDADVCEVDLFCHAPVSLEWQHVMASARRRFERALAQSLAFCTPSEASELLMRRSSKRLVSTMLEKLTALSFRVASKWLGANHITVRTRV